MLDNSSERDQRSGSNAAHVDRRWSDSVLLAVAFGLIYFAAGELSAQLRTVGFVTVFWPPVGIASGLLIALGPRARWPIVVAVIASKTAVGFLLHETYRLTAVTTASELAQLLITAGLIERYFGTGFRIGRLRCMMGFIVAAAVGNLVGALCRALTYSTVEMQTEFLNIVGTWFGSAFTGNLSTAPLVIGLIAALRQPPARRELIEGTVAIGVLAAITVMAILLPQRLWETVTPLVWLFPALFWLAVRCRPVFSAAGTFVASLIIVVTTIYGVGHFGPRLLMADRTLGAQVSIQILALSSFILAALFAERRENERRLAVSNAALERERDNKLMNLEALTGAIVHEFQQPLGAISMNYSVALECLEETPPDLQEARVALADIGKSINRAGDAVRGIRGLISKPERTRQPTDVNEILLGMLDGLRGELGAHGVVAEPELAPELPLVHGNRSQLQEVVFNLVYNAIDAMKTTTNKRRVLRLKTEVEDGKAIAIVVEDSGSGIDAKQLEAIFEPFMTTKPQGMGLGLTICRTIVEHHGGRLVASSDGTSGAVFTIILPIGASSETTD